MGCLRTKVSEDLDLSRGRRAAAVSRCSSAGACHAVVGMKDDRNEASLPGGGAGGSPKLAIGMSEDPEAVRGRTDAV